MMTKYEKSRTTYNGPRSCSNRIYSQKRRTKQQEEPRAGTYRPSFSPYNATFRKGRLRSLNTQLNDKFVESSFLSSKRKLEEKTNIKVPEKPPTKKTKLNIPKLTPNSITSYNNSSLLSSKRVSRQKVIEDLSGTKTESPFMLQLSEYSIRLVKNNDTSKITANQIAEMVGPYVKTLSKMTYYFE
jgi:hypothetical protein